jgi:two-component system phosphate regulon response regulator PhoB
MHKTKVLIVEDDKNLSKLVKFNLEKADYECDTAFSGEAAVDFLQKKPVDLIILDVMLPNIDGFEVCRRVRQNARTKDIPILMLTARGEEVDKIVGLELGADDYMVKPFSPRELVLRIKAILKRGKIPEETKKDVLEAEGIVIDLLKHQVTAQNKKIDLTLMEFKLLSTLVENRGRVQSRESLLTDVWGFNEEVNTRTIDTHVKRLREKLGKSGKAIQTVIGIGYRFKDRED